MTDYVSPLAPAATAPHDANHPLWLAVVDIIADSLALALPAMLSVPLVWSWDAVVVAGERRGTGERLAVVDGRLTMKCPKCSSENVVIATAGNGFGTWKCNACNAFGSYPPHDPKKFAFVRAICKVWMYPATVYVGECWYAN